MYGSTEVHLLHAHPTSTPNCSMNSRCPQPECNHLPATRYVLWVSESLLPASSVKSQPLSWHVCSTGLTYGQIQPDSSPGTSKCSVQGTGCAVPSPVCVLLHSSPLPSVWEATSQKESPQSPQTDRQYRRQWKPTATGYCQWPPPNQVYWSRHRLSSPRYLAYRCQKDISFRPLSGRQKPLSAA